MNTYMEIIKDALSQTIKEQVYEIKDKGLNDFRVITVSENSMFSYSELTALYNILKRYSVSVSIITLKNGLRINI